MRLDEKRGSRIKAEMEGNIFEQEQWPNMIDYMTDAMVKLKGTFVEPLKKLNQQLKSK